MLDMQCWNGIAASLSCGLRSTPSFCGAFVDSKGLDTIQLAIGSSIMCCHQSFLELNHLSLLQVGTSCLEQLQVGCLLHWHVQSLSVNVWTKCLDF